MKKILLFLLLTLQTLLVLAQISNQTHDSLGRLTNVMYPDSSTITFAYDANGNLTNKRYHDPCETKQRPQITVSGATTFCDGGSVDLSITPGIRFRWSNGDTTHTTITAAAAGSYSVQRLDSFAIIAISDTIQCYLNSDTTVITVNPIPVITPVPDQSVCNGVVTESIDFTSSEPFTTYSWTNTNPAIGLAASGTGSIAAFSPINASTAPITAAIIVTPTASGCAGVPDTFIISVKPTPTVLPPPAQVLCAGSSTTAIMFTGSVGGTTFNWTNSNPSIGLTTSGIGNISSFTATNSTLALITATISVTPVANGCSGSSQEFTITVNPLPPPISGTGSICQGTTETLTNAIPGGTWNSSSPNISVGATSGAATGVSLGTSFITYTLSTGCKTIRMHTVNPLPAAITGIAYVCTGFTTNLHSATPGGIWSSSDLSVATIAASTGLVTGVGSGTVTISYVIPTGCAAITTLTVNAVPPPISGAASVCVGSTIALGNEVAGGSWTSSTPSKATVDPLSGVVSGLSPGATIITYSLSTGCYVTKVISVNPLPANITGSSSVCPAATILLANAFNGGSWSSGDVSVATIGTGSGIVTGIAPGLVSITYTLISGCYKTKMLTVNPLPSDISGAGYVCASASVVLSSSPIGGTWTSSSTSVAMVGFTSGILTGVSAGTATITYTLGTGCRKTTTVTTNPLPSLIVGAGSVCVGLTRTLSNPTVGGTWSSDNSTIAAISPSGVVSGVSSGVTTITYMLGTGCFRTANIIVNPLPAAISGSTNVCEGLAITLTDPTPGGTWSASPGTVALVGPTTGVVSGVAAGTAVVTYRLPTTCQVTSVVTVNPLPPPIAGLSNVCIWETIALSNAIMGGTWTSSNPGIGTVEAPTGAVSGISAGITEITYTLNTGCIRTKSITVNPLPAAIAGPDFVCMAASITLTNDSMGGTWMNGSPGIINLGSATGIVSGVSSGIGTVSYVLPTGCVATKLITVDPVPGDITGVSHLCLGQTSTLTSLTGGGTWASSNTSVATIGSTTGNFTGHTAGTSGITYTLATGCYTTKIVTVYPYPSAISGPATVCQSATITLTNTTTGGVWNTTSIDVIDLAGTGSVYGISPGTATVSYTLSSGCSSTKIATVNSVPPAITGTTNVCPGSTITLDNILTGGTWVSSNPAKATINTTTGVVTGIAAGTALITYTLGTGCSTTLGVTVNAGVSIITGTAGICVGSSATLSTATTGGIWSTDNPTVVTVGSGTGYINGLSTGTGTISYTVSSSGCSAGKVVTVFPMPAAITGSANMCVGGSTILSNTSTGGTWTSSSTSIASVGSVSGIVAGVSAGNTTISYTLANGCRTTIIATVQSLPGVITGNLSLCAGNATTLSSSSAGGTWTSGNITVATIGASSGVVSGLSTGTTIITYTLSTGCSRTAIVSVAATPSSIAGTSTMCVGATTTLSNATAGGSWSSSNSGIASIGFSTGMVSAVSAGTATITYSVGVGCIVTRVQTIDTSPSTIAGTAAVCTGSTTTLSNTVGGGTWTSGNPSVATIVPATGIVAGVAVGTATITYSLGSGCSAYRVVSVTGTPSGITGTPTVCIGSLTTLSNSTAGGAWTSSNTSVATVSVSTGVVSGINSGTATITYTLTTGCKTTTTVSVNSSPSAITGYPIMCVGSTASVSNGTAGGTWSSSNTAIAIIGSSSGIISGISGGNATVTYTISTGCRSTKAVTVNALPSVIAGPSSVCMGSNTNLTNSTSGGTWSSSNATVAPVSGSGVVTGVTIGTVTITYVLSTGCFRTTTIAVNETPSAISGAGVACVGATTTLTNSTPSGVWSSSNTSKATIGSSSGIVTGVAYGVSTISYTLPNGCRSTVIATINPLPGAIVGSSAMCEGTVLTLTNPTTGGSWSSSNTAVGSIGIGSGIVVAGTPGTTTISYTLGTTCFVTKVITTNPLPAVISGPVSVCVGSATTLTSGSTGGTWTSSNSAIASIGGGTGAVSGINSGTVNITYSLSTGCKRTTPFTVNPLPALLSGSSIFCVGSSTLLTVASPGGIWNSSNPSVTSIGSATGIATGVSPGTAFISYTLPSGCFKTKAMTVNPLPNAGTISGLSSVIIGSSITLSNSITGGVWSSSTPSVATVSTVGMVTAVSIGSATMSYTVANGCGSSSSFHVVSVTLFRPIKDSTEDAIQIAGPGSGFGSIFIYPNPNTGSFIVKGSLGFKEGGDAILKVTDDYGRVVFRSIIKIQNGDFNESITLDNTLANGNYKFSIEFGSEIETLKFVIIR